MIDVDATVDQFIDYMDTRHERKLPQGLSVKSDPADDKHVIADFNGLVFRQDVKGGRHSQSIEMSSAVLVPLYHEDHDTWTTR